MSTADTLFLNARIVNEGEIREADVLVRAGCIESIDSDLSAREANQVFDLAGMWLLPGLIDDQVHFREPGMEHKADMHSESGAAVAGGVTSFVDMPNTNPTTDNLDALQDKYNRANGRAWGNYSFHFGATESNAGTLARLTRKDCAGIKVFMGSSTGDLLVEDEAALNEIFRVAQLPVLVHAEKNAIIAEARARLLAEGRELHPQDHPEMRPREACFASSSQAVQLAKEHGTQLHILHLTTAEEMDLFEPGPIEGKQITAEVCVHHLHFCDQDYPSLGNRLVCNPSVKTQADRDALRQALIDGRINIIATDHAPHTLQEKQLPYGEAPAGLPLVQHSLLVLLQLCEEGVLSLEQVVEKACHAPAIRFGVSQRGFLREGYRADLVVVDPQGRTSGDENLQSRCGWSPFSGHEFSARIQGTWVNGVQVWDGSKLVNAPAGQRLELE